MIQSGDVESERIPDIRRCERIRWPRAVIENWSDPAVKTWHQKRGSNERVALLLESERYLVILADREDFVLPWTAYPVEKDRQLARLLREHADYHQKNR